MAEQLTEAGVKNIVNEKFSHHWEVALPQYCERNHELSETKIGHCVAKKLNSFLWKIIIALIIINFGAAFSMYKILSKFVHE